MVQIRDPATGRTITVERRPIRPTDKAMASGRAMAEAVQKLADAGGVWTFTGLYAGDTRLRARLVEGKYGLSWLLDDAEAAARGGKKWVTFGATSKAQKAMGLRERPELAAARVHMVGPRATFMRQGCMWGSDARLKFTTSEGTNP